MRPKSFYRDDMFARFWKYHNETFRGRMELFERPEMPDGRPPVFLKHADAFNVITAADISPNDHRRLMGEIPLRERHRWFRSWKHVPRIFKWTADADLAPCPLRANYQLVRKRAPRPG